mmetsp:Transcript_23666/g.36521  ORF Transcript_23666/g.36521 Transcript_23666/m.36521 type:complete len:221 (-) Transcript_23666:709-1371(-)
MGVQIIGLRLHGKLIDIIQYTSDMLLQGLHRVGKVVVLELLLGRSVVGFHSNHELVGSIGIIVLKNFVQEQVPYMGSNLTSFSLKQQISKIKAKFFNFLLKMNGFAKNSFAIIVQKSVFGKDGCGVGRISQRNGQWGTGLNIVHGIDNAVALLIKGKFHVGVCIVIEHICHGNQVLLSGGLPNLVESSQCNIIGPLDNLIVINRVGSKGHVPLANGIDES